MVWMKVLFSDPGMTRIELLNPRTVKDKVEHQDSRYKKFMNNILVTYL